MKHGGTSLIVLKSELASKLASRDVERAVVEIREVEVITRKALAEMREAVRGYRTTLADEVAQARELLDAAGIRADVDIPDNLQLPRATDDILGVSLRELVTNVVRHSRASTCAVRIVTGDEVRLEVADNGQGGSGVGGSGLDGLRQRLDVVGGSLQLDGTSGFRAVVTMPNAPAVAHESVNESDVRVAV
jgi:two-component system, NarL family, sensor histidine kinase DesK